MLAASVVTACKTMAHNLNKSGLLEAANAYDADTEVHEKTVRRTLDSAITTRHLLVKSTAATTADINGAATIPIGTVDNVLAAAEGGNVLLLGKGSTKKMVASEAIAITDEIFTAASGKIQNRPTASGTYYFLGLPLTTAAADGDIIEVADCVPVKVVVP